MQQRRMGRSGLKVSNICLGTMTFAGQADEATSRKILDAAFEQGVTFIDTADAYPIPPEPETAGFTEEVIGGWLAAARGRRDELVLATKCRIRVGHGPNDQGLSRHTSSRHATRACGDCGPTISTSTRPTRPIPKHRSKKPCRTFDDLVRWGKVRYVGCSNYAAWQLALALGTSAMHELARYDCLQPRYNALHRDIETELLPLCRDQGIGVIVYNPLAGGFLTGKHQADAPPTAGTRFTLGAAGELYRERYWHAAQFEAVANLKAFCRSGR